MGHKQIRDYQENATVSSTDKLLVQDSNGDYKFVTYDTLRQTDDNIHQAAIKNFVSSGLTIATSASLSTTIAAGVAIVNGIYVSTSATAKTFTASKDTYVDLKDDGTFAYVAVANGATSGMTLTTNSDGTNALRIAKVVTNGTAVTTVTQSGADSLVNYIYPSNPRGFHKYTDANGWTVRDFGSHKDYYYNVAGITNTVAPGQRATITSSLATPVGRTTSNTMYFPTYWGNFAAHGIPGVQDNTTTLFVFIANQYNGGNLTFTGNIYIQGIEI